MPSPLLPCQHTLPLWNAKGQRVLEVSRQAHSPQPLMQLAGLSLAKLARAVTPHARRVCVLAGPGNNGGDGLEAACHLQQLDLEVRVHLIGEPDRLPPDAHTAWQKACHKGVPIFKGLPPATWTLASQDLCIDALLGLGASRAPEGELQQAIDWINTCGARVLAADLPSGLGADSGQAIGAPASVVRADHTLTFLAAKPGLFMGMGRDVCGQLWLDGLARATPGEPAPDAWLNPPAAQHPRHHASHKGSHGDVAIVGGESLGTNGPGMTGAAVLAATSALHAGAGRVFLSLLGPATSGIAWPADLMQRPWQELDHGQMTVVAGCGGGRAIAQALPQLMQRSARLVLDADALNAIASDPWLQELLRQRGNKPTVLTPHPLEAARLLGWTTPQVQQNRLEAATTLAEQLGCTVVLKGSGTVIAQTGQTPHINPTGNGRLAVGGTGDVLAGLTGALLARSHSAWQAACEAAWLHGTAADQWPTNQPLTASALAQTLLS